jgi:hypothetical protein
MKTTIVFTDDRHTDKKAVITVEEGKGGRLEFFPACGEDDKEQRSYAHLAKLLIETLIANKL